MVGEIEAAGQLVDAGLIGSSLTEGGHGAQDHDAQCANCGTSLTGRYCSVCGQRGAVHRSLLHLLEEFFHGLLHFDGKIWRTLPLLFVRPGALTRRYVQGQRVRFVSPIALFFFSVFLMFFAVSTLDPKSFINGGDDKAVTAPVFKADLKKAREELKEAGESPDAKKSAGAKIALKTVDQALSKAESMDEGDDGKVDIPLVSTGDGMDWRGKLREWADDPEFFQFASADSELSKKAREALRNPDLFLYKIKNGASEFSFLLIPLSVPFLWFVFLFRRRVYLYDHVIFLLHSLSFVAVFIAAWAVAWDFHATRYAPIAMGLAPILVPPLHLFFHLKGAYQTSIWGAWWRTWFLSMTALLVLSLYLVVIILLGVAH
jgi:hypothetical protein